MVTVAFETSSLESDEWEQAVSTAPPSIVVKKNVVAAAMPTAPLLTNFFIITPFCYETF